MGTYDPKWNLDSLYKGGSDSADFAKLLERCEADLGVIDGLIEALGDAPGDDWVKATLDLQDLSARLWEAIDFVECLEAQDVGDTRASQMMGQIQTMSSKRGTLQTKLETRFLAADDEAWRSFLALPETTPIAFFLNEQREVARLKMAPEQEILAEELATNGYHAWGRMYDKIAGGLRVEFVEDGKKSTLSMGQLHNKMEHRDRAIRRQAFEKLEGAWGDVASVTAHTLNSQAGFRLNLYGKRAWDSVLDEPLRINRIRRETLDAMWGVVAAESERLLPYMDAKAKLLGLEKLSWYDVGAPVGEVEKKYTYDEAAAFILDQFGRFSGDLQSFSKHAIENRWIEAEDRPGKRAGGFCTDFPIAGETRIFMTFGGNYGSVSTLGHELGHSYHTWLIREQPFWCTNYPMTLAETASTFCETIISDAALAAAESTDERRALLAIKAEEALIMMMNLRARFVFETAFFEARRKSELTVDELCDLMVKAQRECYRDGLDPNGYHPLFWASKLHFYITNMPFYNFPYVFGYLFSSGLYERALQEGSSFAEKYVALLRETGHLNCEDLARKHLGVDLTKPEFWKSAVDRALGSAEEFVSLAP